MIICYKFNFITYLIAKVMVKLSWFSLPNLLANKSLVPELLQSEVTVNNIVPLVKERLYSDQTSLNQSFTDIHLSLKQNASEQACQVVLEMLNLDKKSNEAFEHIDDNPKGLTQNNNHSNNSFSG